MQYGEGGVEAALAPPPAIPPPVHVLIVDDDPTILESADRLLGKGGFITATAFDGPGALQVDDRLGPFELLIAAAEMPDMTGLELAQQIRQQRPDLKVLFLISSADMECPHETKPVANEAWLASSAGTLNGLIETVSALLNRP
jgi:CheY-like chemotaxis protein